MSAVEERRSVRPRPAPSRNPSADEMASFDELAAIKRMGDI